MARARLSGSVPIRAAVQIADNEGIEGVMALSPEIGVTPTVLRWYLPDKPAIDAVRLGLNDHQIYFEFEEEYGMLGDATDVSAVTSRGRGPVGASARRCTWREDFR